MFADVLKAIIIPRPLTLEQLRGFKVGLLITILFFAERILWATSP